MATERSTYVIGDIHGQFKRLVGLLQSAGLIGDALQWTGGASTLWFIGDLVDRGPDGIPVIDLVMRLQSEAAAVNGSVASLLGNHEMLLLAAYRFGRRSTGLGSSFLSKWKRNGGNRKDLASLKLEHLDWLADLPAMALVDDHLFIHADAPLYLKYGSSVQEVNATIKDLLHKSDTLAWEELLEDFFRRGIFYSDTHGETFTQRFLDLYEGRLLVHGHTPISHALGCQPKKVTGPLIYARGRCVNVDAGLYLGGHGFVSRLPFSSN